MDRAEFLKQGYILHLSTVDDTGMPHVVPVWYLYDDSVIYIGTSTRTIKAQNILHNGMAAACLDEGVRSPLRGVMLRGPARLLTDTDTVRDLAGRILLRYFDSLEEPSARTLLDDTDCIIELKPRYVSEWS